MQKKSSSTQSSDHSMAVPETTADPVEPLVATQEKAQIQAVKKPHIFPPMVLSLARAAETLAFAELAVPGELTPHDIDEGLRLLSEISGSLERLISNSRLGTCGADPELLALGVGSTEQLAMRRAIVDFATAKREIDYARDMRARVDRED